MALVPFRISGAAASQQLSEQLLQIGPYSLLLHQRPGHSGHTAYLQCSAKQHLALQQSAAAAEGNKEQQEQQQQRPDLSQVGLVLWQSGYVLSDFLLLRYPQLQAGRWGFDSSSWAGVRVLELGCGAGTVGMFLALAGAQVVLTDQAHILPLTRENLELNFPKTARRQSTGAEPNEHTGTGQQQQKHQAKMSLPGVQQHTMFPEHQAPGLSVNAALAAAFCGSSDAVTAPAVSNHPGQQFQLAIASGPLAVEYRWGEAAQLLQQRIAVAAAARLTRSSCTVSAASPATALEVPPKLPTSRDSSNTEHEQQQQLSSEVLLPGDMHPASYDMVVGADLLYDPSCYAALLDSLQQLCAAHTQVFLCYRQRGLGEQAFEELAVECDWTVKQLPPSHLHPEFQAGDYHIMCLTKTG